MPLSTILLVGGITFIGSFFVQYVFYLWYKISRDPLIETYKTVVNYRSGVIGDGILIPAINIFAYWNVVINKRPDLYVNVVPASLIIGFTVTFLFHFGQQYFSLTNWTMPKVGKWNSLGLYHSIFMFCESSFLAYVVLNHILFTSIEYTGVKLFMPITYASYLLFVFFITFLNDYYQLLFKKIFTYPFIVFYKLAYKFLGEYEE